MNELRLELTPSLSAPKLVHCPLHQATKNSSPTPKPGQLSLFPTSLMALLSPQLGEPNSWEIALTLPGPSPLLVSHSCLFHLWNITEIHPLLFISTTMVSVQGDTTFPWNPLPGSCLVHPHSLQCPSDLFSRLLSQCGLSKRQMSSLVDNSLIQSGHFQPLYTHSFLLAFSLSIPFLGKLSLTSLPIS